MLRWDAGPTVLVGAAMPVLALAEGAAELMAGARANRQVGAHMR